MLKTCRILMPCMMLHVDKVRSKWNILPLEKRRTSDNEWDKMTLKWSHQDEKLSSASALKLISI